MGNDYYYGYESEAAAVGGAVVGIILVLYMLLYLALMAYSVVAYIFQAKGFYAVAKRRGFDKPWLAWIPYANFWLLGKIADDYCLKAEGKETNYGKKVLGSWIGFVATEIIFFIAIMVFAFSSGISIGVGDTSGEGIIMLVFLLLVPAALLFIAATIVANVFQYITLYKYLMSCQPSRAVMYLMLSIFIGIPTPFFVYFAGKHDEGMPVTGEVVAD